jgi:hypothetical protein
MASMSAGPAKVERQISLPFSQAFKIALRNITIRLGRAMITGAGSAADNKNNDKTKPQGPVNPAMACGGHWRVSWISNIVQS